MPYHYSFLWKVINWLLLYFLFYFIVLYYIFSTNKDIQKVRHRAEPFSLYQCPSEKHLASIAKGIHLTPKLPPATSAERILLVTRLNAAVGRGNPVLSFLNHFKVPIRIATVDGISGDKLPPLELGNGTGRFSVIIFQDYVLYDSLAKSDKVELLKYCRRHNVALISFLSPDLSRDKRDFELFSIKVAQKQNRLRIPQSSPIKFVGKSSTVLDIDQNWTLIQPMNNVTVILVAEEDNGSELAAAVLLRDPAYDTDHIVIGQIPDNWMVKIILLDSLIYMAPNIANRDLDRFIQIDIDDVFVGQSGTRFVPDDVKQLKQTQDDLRKYIDGFYFTLGFSGYFFRHGDSLEIRGDEELVASANEFYWFPHMWRHNHAHEYAEDYLLALMTQNRIFAENVQLRLLPGYAISPQHSGVYPSYDPLYRAWRSVWNISVTSTEEYPHLRPASARRGFIYSNISVIPRQTCGLFTHTSFFHAYPDGIENLQRNIFGGDLFESILLNPVNVFMTHQQNFANDRLGSFTFLNLVKFLNCWTNLKLKWSPPNNAAQRYFDKYPIEKRLIYTNPCADDRHKRTLSIGDKQWCDSLVLPNVLIVGPQKTGTSALSLFLSLHPNVSTNSPVIGSFEELQFFGGNNYPKALHWYADKFSNISKKCTTVFEKSANYFDNEDAPKTVHALIPNTKLIVILMDPADRAYSWYQHIMAHNDSGIGNYTAEQVFMGNVSAATEKLRNRCLGPGLFAHHLDRWLDYFPPSQLILIDGYQLRQNPISTVQAVYNQLGLSESEFDLNRRLTFVPEKGFYCIVKSDGRSKCLGQSKGRKYPPMTTALRTYLSNFYREHNRALLNLLDHYKFPIPSFLLAN
ncbi:heparan sulfate-N-deacetylase domain-containing protein [Ditylenchus destructor]|uniref:[heparan sulfate]-glucosamine N-sulfotransferase n=1 Tax=Ditylenchus destructor TaxID=166010 RepID=A0AAD4R7N1_9BILA|nr:heparan sulfate-N-deacetylase domain-containing protein [Ditylenchus destructor]